MFLYRHVLDHPLAAEIALARSQRRPRPPTVLTQAEVRRLLAAMTGRHAPMARPRYGAGLRLLECARLRSSRGSQGAPRRAKPRREYSSSPPFLRRFAPQEPVIHSPFCGDRVILDRLAGIIACGL